MNTSTYGVDEMPSLAEKPSWKLGLTKVGPLGGAVNDAYWSLEH
jgi:hypothetical protein